MFVHSAMHFGAMNANNLRKGNTVRDNEKKVTYTVDRVLSTMTYPPRTVIIGKVQPSNKEQSFSYVVDANNMIKELDLVNRVV